MPAEVDAWSSLAGRGEHSALCVGGFDGLESAVSNRSGRQHVGGPDAVLSSATSREATLRLIPAGGPGCCIGRVRPLFPGTVTSAGAGCRLMVRRHQET